jgi:hypothetical protein
VAKKAGKAKPEEMARRVLVRAQLKLEVAQQEHTQERSRGQQEVEKARLRAQKWLAKAAQRVERRAEVVAQAEATLSALTNPPKEASPDGRADKPRAQKKAAAAATPPAAPASTPATTAPAPVQKATTPAAAPTSPAPKPESTRTEQPKSPPVRERAGAPVIVPERIPSMKDAPKPPKDTESGS